MSPQSIVKNITIVQNCYKSRNKLQSIFSMLFNILSIFLFSGLAQSIQTCSDSSVFSEDESYCTAAGLTCCYNETPGYTDHRGPECLFGFLTSGAPDYIPVFPPTPAPGGDCWCYEKGPGGLENC
jgi:hypothetical protein